MHSARLRDREPAPARPLYVPPGAAAVLALRDGCCRWPLGDVGADTFRFCCTPCGPSIYCAAHARLARRSR